MRILTTPLLFAILIASAFTSSNLDPSAKYAHSANSGWINFRHDQPVAPEGVTFADYYLSGKAYGANFGWVGLGDGDPDNGIHYANSGTDFGVNHDGDGNLTGYAYGANIGWIDFGWAATSHPKRARVDLATGTFEGFAYSANVGWINLGTDFLATQSMLVTDTDQDGMSDQWELENFGNLTTATPTSNNDNDRSSDLGEYQAGSDPHDSSSYLKVLSRTYNQDLTQVTVEFASELSRLYCLETSVDMGIAPDVWQDSGHGLIAPWPGGSTTVVHSWPSDDRRFFRLVPQVPLQP